MTSVKDMMVEGLCLGILSGIYWEDGPDLWEKLEKGFEIIPEKLRLRIFTKKDMDIFTSVPPYFALKLRYGEEKHTVLESKNTSTHELFGKEFNPLTKALLAFRLLKAGGIFIDRIYAFESGEIRPIIHPSEPDILPGYGLSLDEIENLIAILKKVQTIDFDKNSPFRIACIRFGRFYLDRFYEDKLVDLCIAFEALFLQGKWIHGPMGQAIGSRCSELLGKNFEERKMIEEQIELAFSLRNKVVHGQDFNFNQIYNLIPNFEDYLRRSIFHLLP